MAGGLPGRAEAAHDFALDRVDFWAMHEPIDRLYDASSGGAEFLQLGKRLVGGTTLRPARRAPNALVVAVIRPLCELDRHWPGKRRSSSGRVHGPEVVPRYARRDRRPTLLPLG